MARGYGRDRGRALGQLGPPGGHRDHGRDERPDGVHGAVLGSDGHEEGRRRIGWRAPTDDPTLDWNSFPIYLCQVTLGSQSGEDDRHQIRPLTDPRTLRAMAHPLRLQLYELITREGTLTTTRASELVGESTASCSFHLRQMAKYGFIEEAPGGRGRERPWRRSQAGFSIPDPGDDPAFAAALGHAASMALERSMRSLADYVQTREQFPQEWRDAALISDALLYLTVDELDELRTTIVEACRVYFDRTVDVTLRPPDARPVGMLAALFPVPPTSTGN